MIFPEEQHPSKERRSCRNNYCHSDSRGRRRDNTAAAAIHSLRRIGCHPDWRFRSSGTPCSPSRSEHHSSLDQYADGGEHRQIGQPSARVLIYVAIRRYLYRARNLVERFFNKIKHRRIATRYDKLAANYLAFVKLAAIRIWLRL
jgi:hypothetical protein